MASNQCLHCIAGSAVWQHTNDMPTHIPGLDLIIIQKPEKAIIFFTSIDYREEVQDLLFEHKLFMAAVIRLSNGFRFQQS